MPTASSTASTIPRSSSRANTLQLVRKVHLYFGLFISPALLFFAFTGAFQTLGLHEDSGNYKPAALLASLGQIHKKQTYLIPVRKAPGPESAHPEAQGSGSARPNAGGPERNGPDRSSAGAAAPAHQPPPATLQSKQKQHLPLKLFFVLVSLGLFSSTLTGVYMAYKYDRNKALVTGLVVAGALLPILLIRF